ncbi:unnamed protein product [Linum tenue]|uniref:Uncharacterized protein n=1 Tax=Linum tenue TaxID=586396 RepID=A0AAV0LIJ6_9ROSI|nr:unnamed protein product [Linum tenue]
MTTPQPPQSSSSTAQSPSLGVPYPPVDPTTHRSARTFSPSETPNPGPPPTPPPSQRSSSSARAGLGSVAP